MSSMPEWYGQVALTMVTYFFPPLPGYFHFVIESSFRFLGEGDKW